MGCEYLNRTLTLGFAGSLYLIGEIMKVYADWKVLVALSNYMYPSSLFNGRHLSLLCLIGINHPQV